MSETTSEPHDSSANSLPCVRLAATGSAPDLLSLCDRVVKWAADFDTMVNRINRAEANGIAGAEFDAIEAQEVQVLLEIDDLAVTITEMHAANPVEIEGKQRALNALTGVGSWERDSLYALRCSIERDLVEVYIAPSASPPPQAERAGWLSRLNPVLADG